MADRGRYRKVFLQFWLDADVRELSHFEQLIALYCLTGPQSNRLGIFEFSAMIAAEYLKPVGEPFTNEVLNGFQVGFRNVCETLGWQYDERARVLYIPSWFKYNAPDNANTMKGCLSDLAKVPETTLLEAFANNTEHLSGTVLNAFRNGLPNRSPTGMATQGTGNREQGLKKDPPSPPSTTVEPEANRPKRKPVQPVTLDTLEFPEGMETPEVRETLERWLAYKRLRREAYKGPESVVLLLKQFAKTYGRDGPREFVEGVKRAMANNWAGCFFGKETHGNQAKDDRLEAAHTRGQRRVFD